MTEQEQPLSNAAVARQGSLERTARPIHGAPRDEFVSVVRPVASASGGFLTAAWRSRWIILLCGILSLGVGVVYVELATPIYTSTSKLYLDYEGIRISRSYEPGDVPQTDKYLYTQAELLQSRPILAAAAQRLGRQGLPASTGADSPVTWLERGASVAVGRKDEVVSISFSCADPLDAARVANEIVEAYMTSRSEHGQKNSSQVLEVLQSERVRTNKELEEKRDALEAFQANKMPLSLGLDQSSVVTQRYLDFQKAMTQAEIAAMEAESFRRGVESLAKDPAALRQYIEVKGGTAAPSGPAAERASLATRITDLQLQQQTILDKLTQDHPTANRLAQEIDLARTRVAELDAQFVTACLEAAAQRHREASDYATGLGQVYETQRQQVVMLNTEIARYQRLRSEVDELLGYSQTLEQQIRDIRKIVGEDMGQLRMQVLEPALPADGPSKPHKEKVIALALFFGLILGGGIAVSRDRIDQTLRSADEISAAFSLPVLGVVPAMSRGRSVRRRGRKVLLEPTSREAEAFRTVRTAVFFGPASSRAKTILITSPATEDGKSTLVSNLAIAVARTGQNTLILDADLRNPIQHRIFGADHQERCLCAVLEGRMTLAQAIQPMSVAGLSLLTCGGVDNPAEILNSRGFADALSQLGRMFDRIVVDAPPVTAVTDAQILGALCDVTLLVLRADRSSRRITRQAIDALRGVGGHVMGIVVNKVHRDGSRYGYYGRRYGSRRAGRRRHSENGERDMRLDAGPPATETGAKTGE